MQGWQRWEGDENLKFMKFSNCYLRSENKRQVLPNLKFSNLYEKIVFLDKKKRWRQSISSKFDRSLKNTREHL